MNFTFKIWRQDGPKATGKFVAYSLKDIGPDMSFLEALDCLNEQLVLKGEKVIAYEYDCREGICGQCGVFINGRAHGPHAHITTCQLHMRSFQDNAIIWVEPFRATAFPIIKDLVIDRSSLDRIIEQGAYITAKTGSAPEANAILVSKKTSNQAMDAASCIGCGACVAACKNASAALFTAAKINHLNQLPQGQPEKNMRTLSMVKQLEYEGFGSCSFTGACEVECPQNISVTNIAQMNMSYIKAKLDQE